MCPQPDEPKSSARFNIRLSEGKRIPVHVYGQGDQLLIALHGFDYDGTVFHAWEAALGDQFTICVPDLPFHGDASWDEKEFKPHHIVEIIQQIKAYQQKARVILAGHSLGARILVCSARELAAIADRFVLLAPAGIGSFDRVPPLWMQRVAEQALEWPRWLEVLVNAGSRLGLVSNFHRRYAEVQLFSAPKRFRLFRTYNSLRHLRTTRSDRLEYWQQNKVETLIILAEQDRFVPNHHIRNYFEEVPEVSIQQVPDNHDLVNKLTATVVRDAVQRQ